MIQPQSPSGAAAGLAAQATASRVREGQVPRSGRPRLRLCFLSVSIAEPEACLAEARRLAGLGLGTALGLDPRERVAVGWEALATLARRSGALGLEPGFVVGAGCEQVSGAASIGEQLEGVAQQAAAIEEAGGVPLVLPLAALARRRATETEYVECYKALLARVSGPLLLDWTGPAARPELLDYFPGKSFERVMALDPGRVRGARLAGLDVVRETRLRRELLARGQLAFTTDERHLAHLLVGANPGTPPARIPAPERFVELAGSAVALGDFSHAMSEDAARAQRLSVALARLEAGDLEGYLAALDDLG